SCAEGAGWGLWVCDAVDSYEVLVACGNTSYECTRLNHTPCGSAPYGSSSGNGPKSPPSFHSLHATAHAWQPTQVSRSMTSPSFFGDGLGREVKPLPLLHQEVVRNDQISSRLAERFEKPHARAIGDVVDRSLRQRMDLHVDRRGT